MVGYDPVKSSNTTDNQRISAGAITGCVCRALVQPLDVIKIRFQLQTEPISKSNRNSKYFGLVQCLRSVVREEGLASLWKGHVPAQLLSVSYTAVQFSTFHALNELHWRFKNLEKSQSPSSYLLCGSAAGMAGVIASHPFDTIRTRLVGQGEPKVYKNMTQAFIRIFKEDGARGFYRGLTPNLWLVGPQAGSMFFSYKLLQDVFKFLNPNASSHECVIQNLLCGAFAGLVAKSVVYPLDSIKKRLQVQGFEEARSKFGQVKHYKSTIGCLIETVTSETIFGLYKGYLPSLVKASVTTAINFAIYEYLIQLNKKSL